MKTKLLGLMAFCLVLSTSVAKATIVDITITDPLNTETFSVSENPTPASYVNGHDFSIDVHAELNGSPVTDTVYFLNSSQTYLVEQDFVFAIAVITGPKYQLYTGSESNPTFALGTFSADDFYSEFAPATITIALAQTPLPTSWLMLLSGFLGLGFFVYRRTEKGTRAIAAA